MIQLALLEVGLIPDIVSSPLLAIAPDSEAAPMILAGVLLSLVFIYFASKIAGESRLVDLPSVLGELVAGVVVGVSALHLLIFPETDAVASDSVVMTILQIAGLNLESIQEAFTAQSEMLSNVA